MMTFYAAAGSYQIRSEDGKNMPYIMRLGKLQPVSIPEFSLWSTEHGHSFFPDKILQCFRTGLLRFNLVRDTHTA